MKRFEEIKKMYKEQKHLLNYNDIEDLIQMVDLLIKRNSFENGNLKELRIFLKDERIVKIKTRRLMKNEDKFECFDEERKLYFVFNFNEIIYFTIEHLDEINNHIPHID